MPRKVRTTKPKNKHSVDAISKRMEELLPPRRHDMSAPLANVVDGMGLVHAAYNAYSKLSFGGSSSSIIFGVPQMIKSTLQRYPCDRIIMCWDGVHHPRRLELLPTYKSHRQKKRDPEERALMELEIKKLRRLLYRMGIPQCYDPNVEGDDMVYFVAEKMLKTHRVNIISGDKDFMQLINYDLQVFNPRTNSPHGVFAFSPEWGVEIPQFVDYLCMVGDDSDDIPGYRGVGPKTAAEFFKTHYSIKEFLKGNKQFRNIDKDRLKEIWKRNREMIDLPYFCKRNYPEGYHPPFYKGKQFPEFNEVKYRAICIKRNLKTMLYPAFMDLFKNR